MLPPGIYIWESGRSGLCDPATVDTVATSCPSWATEMDRCGPWRKHSCDIPEIGCFLMADVAVETTIVIVGKSTSTMEVSRFLSDRRVLGEWGSVIAVEQVGGRGQLRRPWDSPPGNLHVSTILPEAPSSGLWAEPYSRLSSLLFGHICAVALLELGADIRIKWPNDLLQSERKVGGMLIEERGGVDILGLGLNFAESPPDNRMREDHAVPAGVLRTNTPLPGPLALWETLVNRGKSLYVTLLGELKPSQFVSVLSGHLAWMGREVLVNEREGSSYQAVILGISPEGGLIIRHAEGEEVLFSGSITPR